MIYLKDMVIGDGGESEYIYVYTRYVPNIKK